MSNRIDLNSWSEFEKEVEKIRNVQQSTKGLIRRLLFRGQSDASWQLKTTLERHRETKIAISEYLRIIASLRSEIETFTQNRWEVPDYRDIIGSFTNYDAFHNSDVFYEMYGYMAHIRHHGFPSPLLDWTRSMRIATYFAFADASADKRVSIYVLSEARMHSGSSQEPQIRSLGPNVKTHRRHFLQQCEYTMCAAYSSGEWQFADHNASFEDRIENENLPVNFSNYQFTLPGNQKMEILEMLDRDNINAFSLFGSEESLMETLAIREFHFPDPYFGDN